MGDDKRAPYAPPATVLAVIRRMHDRGLPETIDETAMAVSGVPDSLHARVLAALRFLGLADEAAKRTELFSRLGRATTDEYPALLAEIVQAAYAPVFEFGIDPAQDNDKRIEDAFRSYEPSGQRGSMARLFRGLCQEAGLAPVSEVAAARPPRARQPQPRPPRAQPQRNATIAALTATAGTTGTEWMPFPPTAGGRPTCANAGFGCLKARSITRSMYEKPHRAVRLPIHQLNRKEPDGLRWKH
jgi:Family of unknown function (DUF5343)